MDWNSPEVQRGLVQGALTALGVFVTAVVTVGIWVANRRKDRADAASLRAERAGNLRLALWSDILPIWVGFYVLGSAETKLKQVRDAFGSARSRGDQASTPFVVPAGEPLLVKQLVDDVALLETDEIEPVVRFYHQLERAKEMAEMLRATSYGSLSLDRKEFGLTRLVRLKIRAEDEARRALIALERRLDSPDANRMEMQIGRANVHRVASARAAAGN